jgi:hypothetical protein
MSVEVVHVYFLYVLVQQIVCSNKHGKISHEHVHKHGLGHGCVHRHGNGYGTKMDRNISMYISTDLDPDMDMDTDKDKAYVHVHTDFHVQE